MVLNERLFFFLLLLFGTLLFHEMARTPVIRAARDIGGCGYRFPLPKSHRSTTDAAFIKHSLLVVAFQTSTVASWDERGPELGDQANGSGPLRISSKASST